jgi:hypothetical protein
VWAALDHVQDCLIQQLRHGWPPRRGATTGEHDHGSDLPQPGFRIGDEEIRLWYGEEASPSLVLEPLPLPEIRRR